MLEFVDYSLDNLKKYASLISNSPYLCNDISLGSFFMWNEGVNLQFAVYHNTFITKQDIGDEPAFSYPYGEDVEGAVKALMEYVKIHDLSLLLYGIDESLLENLKKDHRFHSVHANYDRKWSDYIYLFDEMLTFSGKKFNGQRNHINKYKKTYGEPDFREIRQEDIPSLKCLLAEYHMEHGGDEIEEKEFQSSIDLLEHFNELGMYGCALYVNDKPVSVTIGELVGKMFIVHVEKALKKYVGVYPTTFQCFMKYMKEKVGDSIKLVNREDDSGDLGLRTSKNQYHPVYLSHKYVVRLDSPVEKIPDLSFDGGVLNAISEEDKANYYELCTDKDNNRYWGYDYEEDDSIVDVNEDTFFQSQEFDFSLGSSVNFAVRKCSECELIGETIIYHFTSNGYAEIGGRIMKQWQGKGLGSKAFAATADFAEKSLHVKTRAKCYKENIPSYRMITAAGFHQVCEDTVFYYFER